MTNRTAATGAAPDSEQIAQEINRIAGLDLAGVRSLWRATFKKVPPKALTRDLLVRRLAWRIQEKAFGGHDAATLRLLDAYGRQDADKVVLFRRLKPGTSVVREYQGVRHIVTISEGGFVWQGRSYDSLSAIAREITGPGGMGPGSSGCAVGTGPIGPGKHPDGDAPEDRPLRGLYSHLGTGYYALLAEKVEGCMDRQKINGICAKLPLILSWTAFVWVVGNVAGGIHGAHPGGDEGLGFHIFWLLILAQAPFVLGYLFTADWGRWRGPAGFVLQVAALVLAFSPVAYFKL